MMRTALAPSLVTIFRQDLFLGKIALVTGGGTGIGFRTAAELAVLGCTVFIASRKKERLDKAALVINKYLSSISSKGKVFSIPMNIRSEESRKKCLDELFHQTNGKLDFLVNNAGGQFPTAAEDCSDKGWNAVIDLNLTSLFLLSKEVFLRAFQPHQSGVIVNVIADMWRGFPTMVHTGAARAAVHNLTQTLGVEWSSYGVRVVSVAPGTIDSSGLNSYGPGMKDILKETKKFNYTCRFGTVEEVAAAILFLLSPASSFTTATTLKIDGGGSLYNPLHKPTANEDLFPKFEDIRDISENLIKSNL